ncbi:MAG: RNA polymerase factor sigma-54 [Enterobacterales bacterium]|nr:RNA polymerase factor sigma-54 [Enterobacterales bacterium]
MKQSLQLKMSQSLTMTPQLQQAIKLLQLSSLDLDAEIQDVLEANPLLEVEQVNEDQNSENLTSENNQADKHQTEDTRFDDKQFEDSSVSVATEDRKTSENIEKQTIDSDMVGDTQWEDWGYVSQGHGQRNTDNEQFEYQGETSESLRDQLLWQINMSTLSETDRAIAAILIDSINEAGFMSAEIQDIADLINQSLNDTDLAQHQLPDLTQDSEEQTDESQHIQTEEIEAVLHYIQSFEPAGIAARDLQECLLIQLKRKAVADPAYALAKKVLVSEFTQLASRNYRQIIKNLGLTEPQLKLAIELIQSLEPRPANQISQNNAQYIKPDVYVRKDPKGQWVVSLNPDSTPKLKINETYAKLIKRADNSPDNQFLKDNFHDAKWFIKSLQSRNETLLKVATSIVEKQTGFLDYGEEAMKPLVLHDIAEEVEMHESTISRVTTQKYLHTPKGIFELKYFFSSHVGTSAGGECSSTAIRAVIKKLVAAENQAKPLSDSKIAAMLKDQGIKVARRTVAKYRESLAIPPSNERKALM